MSMRKHKKTWQSVPKRSRDFLMAFLPLRVSDRRRPSQSIRIVATYFAVLSICVMGLIPKKALATCSFIDGSMVTLTASFTGSITVGRDVPVGTELYRSRAAVNLSTNVGCTEASVMTYDYASKPYPASGFTSPVYGNQTIYQTNVPGIGVVAWAPTQDKAFPNAITSIKPGSNYQWGYHSFNFSLVKIANVVGTGTISASSLPTVQYRVGTNNLLVENGYAIGSVNVIPGTCTTPDVNVAMGTHLTTELKGVGTTTAPVNFQVVLKNCPQFFGTHSTNNIDKVVTDLNQVNNTIKQQFAPTTSVIDAKNGIFALKPGGATGVGIQMQWSEGVPVDFGYVASNVPSPSNPPGDISIGFNARYYQTAATVTPGAANSSVTVTLTYL